MRFKRSSDLLFEKMNSNKKIYGALSLLSFAGYAWVGFHFLYTRINDANFDVCFFKNLTGLPCLSCGTTRSIIQTLQGHFLAAFFINPLGIPITCILMITPIWIFMDLVRNKRTLAISFTRGEALLKSRKIYLPLIILGLLNWYWNIEKGL